MKLNEIAQDQVRKRILGMLDGYVTTNDKSDLHIAYFAAMKHFPEYQYHGKMYRAITPSFGVQFYGVPGPKTLSHPDIREYLARQSTEHQIFSFSKSLDYVKSTRDPIIIQQTGIGLDILTLLENEWPNYFGRDYYTEFPEQQEVLAPLQQNFKILKPSH